MKVYVVLSENVEYRPGEPHYEKVFGSKESAEKFVYDETRIADILSRAIEYQILEETIEEMFPLLAEEVGWYSESKESKGTLLLYSKAPIHRKLLYKFTYVDDSKWILESV